MIVDTHAGRVARRLALSEQADAVKVERDLCALFPRKSWVDMGHRLVLHGRYMCQSKRPLCERCPLHEVCPSARGEPDGRWTERADRESGVVDSRGEASA
jgi:endonuclease-3